MRSIKCSNSDLNYETKVSIIIPVQNSEKYLEECLESALSQTFKNIEILCIDGGSTDSSQNIIRQMQKKDNRVIYINDLNTSYGYKLNIGIRRAKGEYFAILESDDKMCIDMIEQLYKIASEQDTDVVDADYYQLFCYEGKEYQHRYKKYPSVEYYDHLIYYNKNTYTRFIQTFGIWTALYKKKFIVEQNIQFNESKGASYQDTSFMFLISILTNKEYHLSIPLYQYRVDNLNSSVKNNKKIYEIVGECEFLKDDLEKRGIQETELWDLYYIRKYNAYYWNYCRLSPEANAIFLEKYVKEIKKDIKEGFVNREKFTGDMYNRTFLLIDDKDKFVDIASNIDKNTWITKFCTFLNRLRDREVVIFGAGKRGMELIDIMQQNVNKIKGICDNSSRLHGMDKNGIIITSVKEIVLQFPEAIYLITSWKNEDEMKLQLINEGIKKNNILFFK